MLGLVCVVSLQHSIVAMLIEEQTCEVLLSTEDAM